MLAPNLRLSQLEHLVQLKVIDPCFVGDYGFLPNHRHYRLLLAIYQDDHSLPILNQMDLLFVHPHFDLLAVSQARLHFSFIDLLDQAEPANFLYPAFLFLTYKL